MRIALLLVAVVIGGCSGSSVPVIDGPSPGDPASARSSLSRVEEVVSLCILRDGEVATVHATYRSETGDTVVDGRPWREAYPTTSPPYAEGVSWYIDGQPISIPGRRYPLSKYGLARTLGPTELKRYGEHRGLPLFVEAEDNSEIADVVYLFVRPGCEFHPYQQEFTPGPVRG
jgi:hypothetical protein